MKRRQALQNVALLLGGTIIGGNLFLAGGCKPSTPTVEKLMEPEMQSLLAEIAETILPKTATPGAKEAGVGSFIPVMVRDCYTVEQQKVFLDGITTIEKLSKEKFGNSFDEYCKKVNRWFPNLKGFGKTFGSMHFNWKRWILKEHTTQFIWLIGITLLLLFNYPELTHQNKQLRNTLLGIILGILLIIYLLIRYLKKTGKFKE